MNFDERMNRIENDNPVGVSQTAPTNFEEATLFINSLICEQPHSVTIRDKSRENLLKKRK